MAEPTRSNRALAGIAAAAVTLGVALLVAIPFGPQADARNAVGSAVIDLTPGPVKEWAIQTFGTADKLVLSVLVVAVIGVLAAVTAGFETRRFPLGSLAIVAAGVAGCAAVLSRAGASAVDVIPTLVGTACGVAVLRLLISGRFVNEREPDPAPGAGGAVPDPGRRLSLVTLGFLTAGALAAVTGTVVTRRLSSVADDRASFTPPPLAKPIAPPPPSVQPAGVALPSYVTNNGDFYRIDTALSVPQLSRADWRLRIHGMTDREVIYRFEDLSQFDVVEKMVTLTCVSNPVGGELIGNAVWTGYRVRDLLAGAGIRPDADMVLSTSIDGFTASTPVEAFTDERDSLLAVTMNGEPLPTEHGYPARLVVPGLYGYVSATKWVVDLKVTRFDRDVAYWTPLGWSARGPIKTQSRIDVPRSGAEVARGPVTFGGIAWAQPRGVRAVEVRIDTAGRQGEWQPAKLAGSVTNDAWRLWSFPWQATEPGSYAIAVRTTDNTGYVQTSDVADVIPDGATGWHTVPFAVA